MLAVGLMSGTSMDGIDVAVIDTDGYHNINRLAFCFVPYEPGFIKKIRAILGCSKKSRETEELERKLTLLHAKAVNSLLTEIGIAANRISVIGFHGHTIHHEPSAGFTWQLGDGALLAALTKIDVVANFRSADLARGGEGAPLAPIFHAALMAKAPKPLAVLNLGGVGNVSWIGERNRLMAFDTGPGNSMIDDWLFQNTGTTFDEDGIRACQGKINYNVLNILLQHPHLKRDPPKSLDRNDFDVSLVDGLAVNDGAATLTAFTVACVQASILHFPDPPLNWVVCGGGRHNLAIMSGLRSSLKAQVLPIEAAGYDGDAIEAQAFAYLAVRKLKELPTSFPETTGVSVRTTGGVIHRASS